MKAHHIAILATLYKKPTKEDSWSIGQLSRAVGMGPASIRNALRDLFYLNSGALVLPADFPRPDVVYDCEYWKLSSEGRLVVETMKKYFCRRKY